MKENADVKICVNKLDADELKMMSNVVLSCAYDVVSKYPEPKREEYGNEEEYKKAFNNYLLFLVDYVSKIKYRVFSDVLNIYNDYISTERELVDSVEELTDRIEWHIDCYDTNIRRNYIVTLVCCLLAPKSFLIFLAFGVFKYIINKTGKKRALIISKEQKERLSKFSKNIDEIYLFQDDLRTDYHKRKDELEELKRMILNGKVNKSNKELFISRLRELINPEGYSLKKLDEIFHEDTMYLLNLMGKDEMIDKQPQIVKK